jgi:hypothetical protein
MTTTRSELNFFTADTSWEIKLGKFPCAGKIPGGGESSQAGPLLPRLSALDLIVQKD